MEGAAVVVMEVETTSGKPLVEFFIAKAIDGMAVFVVEGETTPGKPMA